MPSLTNSECAKRKLRSVTQSPLPCLAESEPLQMVACWRILLDIVGYGMIKWISGKSLPSKLSGKSVVEVAVDLTCGPQAPP